VKSNPLFSRQLVTNQPKPFVYRDGSRKEKRGSTVNYSSKKEEDHET
jgi:hypothetical protein